MATQFYRQLQRHEFEHPDRISQSVVDFAYEVRCAVAKPMVILQDACPPDSTAHAPYSLHKWGIQHAQSYRLRTLVSDLGAQGKAIDFYFVYDYSSNPGALLRDFMTIPSMRGWGGLGVYPDWSPRPGFHIDTRDPNHPTYRSWWIGRKNSDGSQRYIYDPTPEDIGRLLG